MPGLDLSELHGSVTDPALESMNFVDEIAERYPDAWSGGRSRPAARLCARIKDGFGVRPPRQAVFVHARRLTATVAEQERSGGGPVGPPPIRPRNR